MNREQLILLSYEKRRQKMKLSIENKNVELVFTTRKIVNLTKELKEKI